MPVHHDYSNDPLPLLEPRGRHGRNMDGGFVPGDNKTHDCEYEADVKAWQQRDKHRWVVIPVLITLTVGALITISTCLYTQGQAAGSTAVRVESLEDRANEDRAATVDRVERQRQQDILEAQRHEELMQAIHGIDSRLGRVEERLANRRSAAPGTNFAPRASPPP